ncbi:MAG: crosslink repair DNA glycosylase YcaQ family protein [Rhodobacterales bacterium]|nr:crosslink repair DNA glycosylase YcaQ family protein [Rhodobacterales bacterium]
MTLPRLTNTHARRVFLERHALCDISTGPQPDTLLTLIHRLGFVQVDSINTVGRAHDMILRARYPAYRTRDMDQLLEVDHTLFEHWTHDAAIIPTAFYPHWKLRFLRDAQTLRKRWKNWRRAGFEEKFVSILAQIDRDGPVSSKDVGKDETRKSGGWWDWHPSKTALEYLWRSGDLAVTKRIGFQKYYDLEKRVVPDKFLNPLPEHHETIAWCCAQALERLGFATPKELSAFWDTVTLQEAKDWCDAQLAAGELVEIEVENHDKTYRASFARPDIMECAENAPPPPARVRILSPFDPALRDRNRAERLFGFHYRIEVFVPAAKRQYGYYVFPILQGDRLIGRIDIKAHRDISTLKVTSLWLESGVRPSKARLASLHADLNRMARFSGCDTVSYSDNWLKTPYPELFMKRRKSFGGRRSSC